jgi:hypothetical protein
MTELDFWKSGTGKKLTGTPKDSFIADFTLIPNGTIANGIIKQFELVDKIADYGHKKYYEVIYKLLDGDFKGRQVSQKIKCFDGKPESIDRNLNMLMLVLKLCEFTPSHKGAPTNEEIAALQGKMAEIKIGEWDLEKKDKSGFIYGNKVVEVHPYDSMPIETGVKIVYAEVTSKPAKPEQEQRLDSAFSRNAALAPVLDDDIPF